MKFSASGSPIQFYEVQFSASGSPIQFYEVKLSATGCPIQFYEVQFSATGNFDGVQFSANPSLSQFYCYSRPGLASLEYCSHWLHNLIPSGAIPSLFGWVAILHLCHVCSIPMGGKPERVLGGSTLSRPQRHPIL